MVDRSAQGSADGRTGIGWDAALEGWRVCSHPLAAAVLRDSRTFTVDDPRFSTRRLTGPSMLTADGAEHARHRAAFAADFRAGAVQSALAEGLHAEAARLVRVRARAAELEVRAELAQPLAVDGLRRVLGLQSIGADELIHWYRELTSAFDADLGLDRGSGPAPVIEEMLCRCAPLERPAALSLQEYVANLAIMLIGGIETVEGMICHAVEHRYRPGGEAVDAAECPEFIEESLRRMTPVLRLDRYATRDCVLGGARIDAGDLIVVSVDDANLDPEVFEDPTRLDPGRGNQARHLSFAVGPHYCLGVHLARLETSAALAALERGFSGARLEPGRSEPSTGSIFRKPARLTLVRE